MMEMLFHKCLVRFLLSFISQLQVEQSGAAWSRALKAFTKTGPFLPPMQRDISEVFSYVVKVIRLGNVKEVLEENPIEKD